MLHSALPRAYLGYHHPHLANSSYFEEAVIAAQHQHQHPHPYYQQLDPESYQRVLAWDTSAAVHQTRSSTPCPLDLSLKPAAAVDYEPIEVDDEEDRRSREEARSRHSSYRGDEDVVVDDERSRCSSTHSYQQLTPAYNVELRTPVKGSHKDTMMLEMSYHQPQPHPSPMTPPSTPSPPQHLQHQPQKRKREEDTQHTPKQACQEKAPRPKKKHARKLKFDEDTSSPVSGTVILGPDEAVVTGDIDPAFNIVEVTEEARAELAKIENRLGPYQCKLCRQLHEDAFQLAQHRCSRIAHVEYRCPECDKRFSCPANLASHRRWHKPRPGASTSTSTSTSGSGSEESSSEGLACTRCEAKFSKQAALKKHMASQHPEQNNNNQELKNPSLELA